MKRIFEKVVISVLVAICLAFAWSVKDTGKQIINQPKVDAIQDTVLNREIKKNIRPLFLGIFLRRFVGRMVSLILLFLIILRRIGL